MNDWQTYRNGPPGAVGSGAPGASPRCKAGLSLASGPDNAGGLMLIHKASSTVLLGAGYTATAEMILEFMERERVQ